MRGKAGLAGRANPFGPSPTSSKCSHDVLHFLSPHFSFIRIVACDLQNVVLKVLANSLQYHQNRTPTVNNHTTIKISSPPSSNMSTTTSCLAELHSLITNLSHLILLRLLASLTVLQVLHALFFLSDIYYHLKSSRLFLHSSLITAEGALIAILSTYFLVHSAIWGVPRGEIQWAQEIIDREMREKKMWAVAALAKVGFEWYWMHGWRKRMLRALRK